jgi:SAM-dependent methyltransferase
MVVAECREPLAGARVLDLGAGTGAVSTLVAAQGARVVAADLALDMLRLRADGRPPAVRADALRLPCRDAAFGAVIAAFLLNHFGDPLPVLREAARVTAPGGVIVASTFVAGPDPVKTTLDATVQAHGWEAPAWYLANKAAADRLLGDPDGLVGLARWAGLGDARVLQRNVPMPALGPRDAVAYRFGLAHIVWWLDGLPPGQRAAIEAEAEAAVAPLISTWSIAMLVLVAGWG